MRTYDEKESKDILNTFIDKIKKTGYGTLFTDTFNNSAKNDMKDKLLEAIDAVMEKIPKNKPEILKTYIDMRVNLKNNTMDLSNFGNLIDSSKSTMETLRTLRQEMAGNQNRASDLTEDGPTIKPSMGKSIT